MVHSMTGFTRHSVQKDTGILTIEIRALNHRYFELDLKLPEPLRELEESFRLEAAQYLRRGKIECHCRFKIAEAAADLFRLNQDVVRQLSVLNTQIGALWKGDITCSLTELLNWPGVIHTMDINREQLGEAALALFREAVQDLVAMRQREGAALHERLTNKLQEVLAEIQRIKQRIPVVLAQQRSKILSRVNEFKLAADSMRLEEEILSLIQKMDVTEEIDRLEIHVHEVRQTLNTTSAIGRRLDFLMQELHREANTLGAKSFDAHINHAAIHLKVLIEQMREQVQNIE